MSRLTAITATLLLLLGSWSAVSAEKLEITYDMPPYKVENSMHPQSYFTLSEIMPGYEYPFGDYPGPPRDLELARNFVQPPRYPDDWPSTAIVAGHIHEDVPFVVTALVDETSNATGLGILHKVANLAITAAHNDYKLLGVCQATGGSLSGQWGMYYNADEECVVPVYDGRGWSLEITESFDLLQAHPAQVNWIPHDEYSAAQESSNWLTTSTTCRGSSEKVVVPTVANLATGVATQVIEYELGLELPLGEQLFHTLVGSVVGDKCVSGVKEPTGLLGWGVVVMDEWQVLHVSNAWGPRPANHEGAPVFDESIALRHPLSGKCIGQSGNQVVSVDCAEQSAGSTDLYMLENGWIVSEDGSCLNYSDDAGLTFKPSPCDLRPTNEFFLTDDQRLMTHGDICFGMSGDEFAARLECSSLSGSDLHFDVVPKRKITVRNSSAIDGQIVATGSLRPDKPHRPAGCYGEGCEMEFREGERVTITALSIGGREQLDLVDGWTGGNLPCEEGAGSATCTFTVGAQNYDLEFSMSEGFEPKTVDYAFQVKQGSQCLRVPESGGKATLSDCNEGDFEQMFRAGFAGVPKLLRASLLSGPTCLGPERDHTGSDKDGLGLVQEQCQTSGDGPFTLTTSGHIQMRNMCLETRGNSVVYTKCENNDSAQVWELQQVSAPNMLQVGHSGRCMDKGHSTSPGKQMQMWECGKDNGNQRFTFLSKGIPVSAVAAIERNLLVQVETGVPGQCLTVEGNGGDGSPIIQDDCGSDVPLKQAFRLRPKSDKNEWFEIRVDEDFGYRSCIDAHAYDMENLGKFVLWECGEGTNQIFRNALEVSDEEMENYFVKKQTELAQGMRMIVAKNSGKCIDKTGSMDSGSRPHQWDCLDGHENQQWEFVSTGENLIYTIRNQASGLCLEVAGRSKANGAKILQWRCTGGDNQKWFVAAQPNENFGWSWLMPEHADQKCLEVRHGDEENGTQFILNECDGNVVDNQLFQAYR